MTLKPFRRFVTYSLHVAAGARQKYSFEESLFSVTGNIIVANFASARDLSERINKKREQENIFDQYVTPGLINAAGLLHEIFHSIIRSYEEANEGTFSRGLSYLKEQVGEEHVEQLLLTFTESFPPLPVYKKQLTAKEYLVGTTEEKPNVEIILEELLLLHFENINPALKPLKEFFDETVLAGKTEYKKIIAETKSFFKDESPFPGGMSSLFETLEQLILVNGGSIEKQLAALHYHIKDDGMMQRILLGGDLVKEDIKIFIPHGTFGTPPVPDFKSAQHSATHQQQEFKEGKKVEIDEVNLSYTEPEEYTVDLDWMPQVVMIAKNTYVWLDQLSKQYQAAIYRLDQIPDEELNLLAHRNINSLWLIGVWERSNASQKIKQFCGNPEAIASAYSLFDYEIAKDLGGDEAYQNLNYRCKIRGIRLASDMVPNHTGIFSRWILDSPDFFIQAGTPPYPNYRFTGPDLSDDPAVQIHIEDRYYSRNDAAVVFRHTDNRTGEVRYMYHGNDGTNMPWNDTAQLNLLLPDVREALIKKIMRIASMFPIIRFDAAMTLSKKHYQKLWFPQPGSGGSIPSRSDYSMTREQFDEKMPVEFWREVVDRMSKEMPNTLLLAEAFWLMEGYFVRTLGMHRVYNSAFMHMFMKEENAKYRSVIKNTIEFDPEILKRYVNFMSNPDEETAINQFGKGDKYFGVTVMMLTLPGLPMFAHGQIEGFTEKYGMEYRRAYYNEFIDEYLVQRHDQEIFPLIKKRSLFSEVQNFEFFDFVSSEGEINENVFAFSNRIGEDRGLVLYNNAYEAAEGTIFRSVPKAYKSEGTEDKDTKITTLSEALHLSGHHDAFIIFSESKSKLEYLSTAGELNENGFSVRLKGYQYLIYTDFRTVFDTAGEYRALYHFLSGKGVPSIEQALYQFKLLPLHTAFQDLFSKAYLKELAGFTGLSADAGKPEYIPAEKHIFSDGFTMQLKKVIAALSEIGGGHLHSEELIDSIRTDIITFRNSHLHLTTMIVPNTSKQYHLERFLTFFDSSNKKWYISFIIIYLTTRRLLRALSDTNIGTKPAEFFSKFMLEQPLWQSLIRLDNNFASVKSEFDLILLLAGGETVFTKKKPSRSRKYFEDITPAKKTAATIELSQEVTAALMRDNIKAFIGINEAQGITYYNKELFETLLYWDFTLELMRRIEKKIENAAGKYNGTEVYHRVFSGSSFSQSVKEMELIADALLKLSDSVLYRYNHLLHELKTLKIAMPSNKPKKKKKPAVRKKKKTK